MSQNKRKHQNTEGQPQQREPEVKAEQPVEVAETPKAAEPVAEAKKKPELTIVEEKAGPRSELSTQIFAPFQLVIPHGHTPEDIMRPNYWRHVAHILRRPTSKFCRIETVCEDGTWEADIRLIGADDSGCHFRMLSIHETEQIEVPEGFELSFLSDSGWRVMSSGGTVVVQGVASRNKAITSAVSIRASMGV